MNNNDKSIELKDGENGGKKVIGYVYSKKLCEEMKKHEKLEERSFMVNSLLYHTGLLKVGNLLAYFTKLQNNLCCKVPT